MYRVSPPSTGITYTRSADCIPVCGRAYTMLSIFTASTRPSDLTGLPVNGSSSGPRGFVGVGCGVTLGRGATVAAAIDRSGAGWPPGMRAKVRDSAVAAATPSPVAAVMRGCRDTACRSRPIVPFGQLMGSPSVVRVSWLPPAPGMIDDNQRGSAVSEVFRHRRVSPVPGGARGHRVKHEPVRDDPG